MNEDSKIFTFINNEDNIRIDSVLRDVMHLPQSVICKGARKGLILVNKKREKDFTKKLFNGDIVSIKYIKHGEAKKLNAHKEVIPHAKIKEIRKAVLVNTSKIVVINKPFGIATQSGGGLKYSVDGIARILFNEGSENQARIVHRLDKDTSGLLVMAKTKEVARILSSAFKNREVKKTYIAILSGIPKSLQGEIITYIRREPNTIVQKYTTINANETNGKIAKTMYKVLEINKELGLAKVELNPVTGRAHQLRVHCSEVLKAPIVGDYRYEGNVDMSRKLHLCAFSIAMPKEIHGEVITLAKLPEFFVMS